MKVHHAHTNRSGLRHAPVDFLLLGPLEARQAGRPLRLGSIKHRMLLAKLLLHANQVVSTEELIDTVWGEQPPATVRQSLQNHVASLRRAIEPDGEPRTLRTRDPGYLVQIDPEQLDLQRFRRLVDEGRGALDSGEPAAAVRLLHEALSLWRGPVLGDVVAAGAAWPELAGVDEERVAALEARIEADLALGRHLELIGELEGLVRRYPLREHLHGQLMLALYRSGRQADALAAYRAARRILVDELGIEPSLRLQRLEQAILAQDPALELLGPSGAEDEPGVQVADRSAAAGEPAGSAEPRLFAERKLVTVLFAEVDEPAAEPGERDPEDVSSMLERHLERVHTEILSFGGVVEHAIGGTMMAVFGVPQTHEDDPERAVRAALAIRDALSGRAELRIAVATGEALVTPGGGPTRVAGDLVTACARLQQAAPAGAVLVSEATERATSRVISYGPASLLALPGRAKPVTVWSALEPRNRTGLEALAARPVPLVGRTLELDALLDAFDRVRASRTPQLVTLVGPAGIGKTRLVAELWQTVEADRDLIAWRQGRSQPYGEGMTFWALGEIIKAEAGILESDTADQIDRKLAQAASYALAGIPGAAAWVTAHLRVLLGGSDERSQPRAGRQEEAFAAWRRFLHGLAARRPLVLVVEDLHWADDALLEFLESLLDCTGSPPGSVPLLLVALTRPELLERRPRWGTGPASTTACPAPSRPAWPPPPAATPCSPRSTCACCATVACAPSSWRARRPASRREGSRSCRCPRRCTRSSPPGWTRSPPPRRRCSRTPPCWAGSAGRAGWRPWATTTATACSSASTGWRPRSSSTGRGARRWPASPSTASGTYSSATSPTARSRARSGRRSTGAWPPGWSRCRPTAWRSGRSAAAPPARSCWRTTTAGRSPSPAPRASRARS